MRRSHITLIPMPAPTARPFTIAMTGLSICSSCFGTRCTPSQSPFFPSSAEGSPSRMRPTSPPEQLVELPPPFVGGPRGAVLELRIRTENLRGGLRQLHVGLAPQELRRRAFGARVPAAHDVREPAIAVELERLLADVELRDLLPHDRIGVGAALLHHSDQAVQRVAQRDVTDVREHVALVRERGDRDTPAFVFPADPVRR